MRFLVFLSLFFLAGCYSPFGMWVQANLSFSVPNRYEKTVTRDGCNRESIRLKIFEEVWASHENEIPEVLARMKKQVLDERLYINDIYVSGWRGDTALIVLASNTPTSLEDQDELERHRFHKIREEKCDCRLCK